MPAAATDRFIKGARRWAGQIGASGVADAVVTTLPLVSVTGLPTDTAVELTIDRVDANGTLTPSKEEIIRGIVSGLNIINAVRGVEGTAQAHSAGAVVEVRLTADQWARLIDGILVEHSQDGSHHFESAATLKEVATPSNPAAGYRKLYMKSDGKVYKLNSAGLEEEVGAGNLTAAQNLLKNGNFINNSTSGYGTTPDDWSSSSANPVQGGIPVLTKQNVIDLLGVADGDIEGLWNLNNDYTDLSANGYNLTASGSPVFSDDGQMTKALDLESGSSQYASIADGSCPALEITGSRTFVCFFKPESVGATQILMAKSGASLTHQIYIQDITNLFKFYIDGLTTNQLVTSHVAAQAGKWYMLVGVYDSANSKLKIWVNGVKTEVTASGSAGDTNGSFWLGRNNGGNYADGLMQNAIVISQALSDDQVKRLFTATMYKGLKMRRSGSNSIISQDLSTNVVESLRGKTVTLRADMYQGVASAGQISILQTLASGATDETIISATDATTGSWLEKYASGTISATAVGIQIRLKHSTTDGNSWFRRVSLYEGAILLPYDHSKEDWSRFPRLLKVDPPKVLSGYEYEENRWFTWASGRNSAGTVPTYTTFDVNKFIVNGKAVRWFLHWTNEAGGTAGVGANNIQLNMPVPFLASVYGDDRGNLGFVEVYENGGTICVGSLHSDNTISVVSARIKNLTTQASITCADQSSAQRWITGQGEYEID